MERRDKKLTKLFGDKAAGDVIHVHVYKVGTLTDPQNKFKVELNAQQNRLTGRAILSEKFTLIIVEGGIKSIRRYSKLMLRRITWDQGLQQELLPNTCYLVWQGVVTEALFKEFRIENLPTEIAVREALEKAGAVQFWDVAKTFNPETDLVQPDI